MTALPAPLVPLEVDLRDFPFMPLFRSRLFSSTFHARATDTEWRAGITLWLKSWEQVPAGSLPDDDVVLCRLAEFGRAVKTWLKVKAMALHGWIKCTDGRLYHPVVAEGVMEAWKRRREQRKRGAAGAEKRWRNDSASNSASIAQPLPQAMPAPMLGDSKRSGSGSGSGSGRDIKSDVEVTQRSMPNGAIENLRGAIRNNPKQNNAQEWDNPIWWQATALTLNVPRRQGETDTDWKDRVYAAKEQRSREAQLEAVRRQGH